MFLKKRDAETPQRASLLEELVDRPGHHASWTGVNAPQHVSGGPWNASPGSPPPQPGPGTACALSDTADKGQAVMAAERHSAGQQGRRREGWGGQ